MVTAGQRCLLVNVHSGNWTLVSFYSRCPQRCIRLSNLPRLTIRDQARQSKMALRRDRGLRRRQRQDHFNPAVIFLPTIRLLQHNTPLRTQPDTPYGPNPLGKAKHFILATFPVSVNTCPFGWPHYLNDPPHTMGRCLSLPRTTFLQTPALQLLRSRA